MTRRNLLSFVLFPILAYSLGAQEEDAPVGANAWFAVAHCAPAVGVLHVSMSNGVHGQAQPGKLLGPVGLKPGPATFTVKAGEKSHDWTVALEADTRIVAVVTSDKEKGLTFEPLALPPAGGEKRQVVRLPGTGNGEWNLGKTILETGKPAMFTGKLIIKNAEGAVVAEGDSEEAGVYLIAPSADEGTFVVLYLP